MSDTDTSSDSERINVTATPRKTAPSQNQDHAKSGIYADRTAVLFHALEDSPVIPKQLIPYIQKISSIIHILASFIEMMFPYIQLIHDKLNRLYIFLAPYNPELLIPSFIGLIMCFFGGSFVTLIAAVEAYRMIGFKETWSALCDIFEDIKSIEVANKKDDDEDLDGDGIPDVQETNAAGLARRKSLLILRTVDPKRIQHAVVAINAGFLAVVATLKMQFAKAITLGHAIAHTIESPVRDYLLPHIESHTPPDYRKWVEPTVIYIINAFAISIAWTIQRIISAFHSAIRGGLMFTRNIIIYLSIKKYININHEETYLDEILGALLAVLGLYFQLSNMFGLPFPLNILLFPFSLAEYALIWVVNTQ